MTTKLAIIGAGAMGSALALGLTQNAPGQFDICAANPSPRPFQTLVKAGVTVTHDNLEASHKADIVVVAVKPWIVADVASQIAPKLDPERQTVVLIAAGLTSAQIREMFTVNGVCPPIVIAIPNTAMQVGCSMTFTVNVSADNPTLERINRMFGFTGSVMTIPEHLLPAATSLASCGIAYAMRYVRATQEGAVELGFRADDARKIIVATLRGAAQLLARDDAHPESEIDRVTTPGGLTIKGLNAMEQAGFSNAVIAGLKASTPH